MFQKVVDALTKNHREKDTEPITGFMLQFKNPDETVATLCPVRLFQNYFNLWQCGKTKIPADKKDPWYIKKQFGHNTHKKYKSKLSEKANLNQHYTCHCIKGYLG